MLLERIEIDAHGTKGLIHLGPFSHRLNAVYAPPGSVKAAIQQFVRDLMLGQAQRRYAASESRRWDAGRLIWADTGGLLYCRREADGTLNGRLTIDFEPRDHGLPPTAEAPRRQLRPISAAVVDWIISTAEERALAPVIKAASLARLDTETASSGSFDRREWEQLHERLAQLDEQLSHERWDGDCAASLHSRQQFLKAELGRLEGATAREPSGQPLPSFREPELHVDPAPLRDNDRRQLQDLDGQITRWRETLQELRDLRQRLMATRAPSRYSRHEPDALPNDANSLQQLEARLESAHRQIDRLADRYTVDTFGPLEPISGDGDDMPAPERACELEVQSDHDFVGQLHGVKSQLYRIYDSFAASSSTTVPSRCGNDSELDQLKRCEAELLASVRYLVRQRQSLVARIAAEHDVPLEPMLAAVGDWQVPSQAVTTSDEIAERQQVLTELQSLRVQIEALTERERLTTERSECVARIAAIYRQRRNDPVIQLRASHWLARLSGGRLRKIQWNSDAVRNAEFSSGQWQIRIDGRKDHDLSSFDRQTANLAVRMAAADALARRGQAIPLLIETPTLFEATRSSRQHVLGQPHPSAWLDTVIQYADSGQQTIVLTSDEETVEQVARRGGTLHSLQRDAAVPPVADTLRSQPTATVRTRSIDRWNQANRDLDAVWQETYGFGDIPEEHSGVATRRENHRRWDALPASQMLETDGRPDHRQMINLYDDLTSHHRPASHDNGAAASSPFFLTVDSRVEQAPSVDAVAAARLRNAGVTRVGQLIASDASDLAKRLGLSDVSASAIRRWQREADLVCRVPQLRGFDARVLVGCGMTDPKQLAAMHPGLLLEKVEAFLATDRGRRILRSGSSYELSRITSWIAAANRSVARSGRHGERKRTEEAAPQVETQRSGQANESHKRGGAERRKTEPTRADDAAESKTSNWTFPLSRRSSLADTPTIGPRTAERLEGIGFYAVDDLLQADPDELADSLDIRRIDGNRVRQWQQLAALMCRVPMLSGYDAQLLVAAGIDQPEQLAELDAESLLDEITPIVESKEGKRILQGSAAPDLEQVTAWIQYAQHHRQLAAA